MSASNAVVRGLAAADVEADAAIEPVVGRLVPRPQGVVPVPTEEPITTSASDDRVAARLAAQLVRTTATDHVVATIAAADQVCADATVHHV